MAKFSENYEVTSEGGNMMSEGGTITGLGGFATGAIVGGLLGYAINGWNNRGYGYGPVNAVPFVNTSCGCGCNDQYSIADVSNLVATKDAQYAQLNATQQSEFNVLSQLYKDNTTLASAICNLGYENAMLSNQVQNQIASASAKADLCCCETQGMVSRIVPELKQFYLEDEVAKLRQINTIQNTNCGFDKVNMNLADIGCGVKAILQKLYEPKTTTATT